MEKHNIDKLFSDKLAGHTPAFNPGHWSQMETLIQAQGNSGSLLWWMAGAGLVIITVISLGSHHYLGAAEGNSLQTSSLVFAQAAINLKLNDGEATYEYTTQGTPVTDTSSSSDASALEEETPNQKTTNTSNDSKEDSSSGLTNSTPTGTPVSTTPTTSTTPKSSTTPLTPPSAEDQADGGAEKIGNKKDDTTITPSGGPAAEKNPGDDLASGPDKGLNPLPTPRAKSKTEPVKKQNSLEAVTGAKKANSPTNETVAMSSKENEIEDTTPVHQARYVPSTKILPSFGSDDRASARGGAGMDMLPTLDPAGDFSNSWKKPSLWETEVDLPYPPEGYKAYKWALAASSGVYASTKLLQSDYNFLKPFMDKRNAEEQSSLTPSFGLEVAFVPGRISVNTGLHFNSVGYEANYSPQEVVVADTIFDNSFYEFTIWEETLIDSVWQDSANGQGGGFWEVDTIQIIMIDSLIVESFDTTFTSQLNEFEQGLKTTYQYLEIPIHLGYTMPLGKKGTHLGVFGGVSVTYLRSVTGAYVSQGLDEIQIAQKRQTVVGLDLIARMRLSQSIGYRTEIFVEGRYRHGMGSVSTSPDYSEKHRMYGGALGLSYKF